jgi:transcriptional regulator with XRE-family HTH domain
MREIDGTASPLAFFGAEFRRARIGAGLSQEQLGQKIGYSGTMVGKIETGERAPSEDLAERSDQVLDTNGLLVRVYDLARRWDGGYPSWFAGWMDRERTATSLCWWEPLVIPGLVQTADYARAILCVGPHSSEDELEGMVSTHRCIGGSKIMHDQLSRLAALATRPTMTVQVVPAENGAHVGLLGAFIIASGNGADTVYMESPDEGQTTELPTTVAKLTQTFNILRAVALSPEASRELIMKVAEERWT